MDTNIQWTKDGQDIPGATRPTLVVYEAGIYHVSAAYSICPNDIFSLGVLLPVYVKDCMTNSVDDPIAGQSAYLSPNPGRDLISILGSEKQYHEYHLLDLFGHTLRSGNVHDNSLSISGVSPGYYVVLLSTGSSTVALPLIIQ